MNLDELTEAPTELEVAAMLAAAQKPDHHLSVEGISILRRLIFDWNRLKEANEIFRRGDESQRAALTRIRKLIENGDSWHKMDAGSLHLIITEALKQ